MRFDAWAPDTFDARAVFQPERSVAGMVIVEEHRALRVDDG
jgi:hypothetical protein